MSFSEEGKVGEITRPFKTKILQAGQSGNEADMKNVRIGTICIARKLKPKTKSLY
jgi:hypothetical protein